jgi:hypothetical protein
MENPSRRGFLTACVMLGSTGLAGCSGRIDGSDTELDVVYPPKEVSDGLWVGIDKSVVSFEREGLSGAGAARTYTNNRIADALRKRFAGQFSRPLVLGFAVNLRYQGVGSSLVTAGTLHDETKPIILDRMKKEGITDISELAESTYSNDGRPDPETKWNKGEAYSEFLASYSAPKRPVTFELEEFGEQTLIFPQREIPMRILYFVRDLTGVGTDGSALVLGGVYPVSNYRNEASTELKRQGNSSISIRIDLNTGLNLQKARRELVERFINELLSEGL